MRWGMLIDLRKCVGCHACTVACQNINGLDLADKWTRVLRIGPVGIFPNINGYYMPVPCMHCKDAPCVDGCPTGASYKREDGVVLVDDNKCIGCKFCMVVCPYGVRLYNEQKGIVEKCIMCYERLENGEPTRCTETCQLKARYCGDLDDPNSEISILIARHNAQPLHPELGTEPSVYYIVP